MAKISEQVRMTLKIFENAQRQVELAAQKRKELRLEALRQVKVSKRGETTTLTFGSRVLKVKRNSHNRLNVFENGGRIVSGYSFGINELRFAVSQNLV
jgi:hypothetical protein